MVIEEAENLYTPLRVNFFFIFFYLRAFTAKLRGAVQTRDSPDHIMFSSGYMSFGRGASSSFIGDLVLAVGGGGRLDFP